MHEIRPTRRLATWGALAIAAAILLGACGDDGDDDASTDTTAAPQSAPADTLSEDTTADTAGGEPGAVLIAGSAFDPTPITVSAGDTVTWTNDDDFVHTSTSDDDRWDSEPIEADGTFEFTFDEPGTYAYFCAIHNFMQGEVVVE